MSSQQKITILIATFNRAESLGRTLTAISEADSAGIQWEAVVLDNRCHDHTSEVVASFADREPVSRFVADRPGKSCALNDALDGLDLGEIVVFADDDITPSAGWIRAISDSVERWPDHKIFGGKIEPQWPDDRPPIGLRVPGARTWALGAHDHGAAEGLYPPGETPVGMNWWARREVFASGKRFNESIGPSGTEVIMGEDTEFLRGLLAEGQGIVFVPDALVSHRIGRERLSDRELRKRAYAQGKGGPHVSGLCHPDLLRDHPRVWKLRRTMILWWARLRYVCAALDVSAERRARKRLAALSDIGYGTEALRMARTSGSDSKEGKGTAIRERRQNV